ncbi:MAG: hypothetical protein ACRD23_12775 [Terriglobales bacterium]
MYKLSAFCTLLLLCGLASGQTRWVPPGTYSEPFAPRLATPTAPPQALVTPFLALDSPSLVAGASNGTMNDVTGSSLHFNQPSWYAPGVELNLPGSQLPVSPGQAQVSSRNIASRKNPGIELGAARFQSSYGAAQLVANRPGRKANRVFTNPDVARVNDANGMIRFGGKEEHID